MVLPALPHKLLTLAFITKRTATRQVLLGLKKRGFGEGKWNGFGGKVESTDANIPAATAREIQEEANVHVSVEDLKPRGVLMFTFEGGKEILEVHVFLAEVFTGEPSESEEMRPQWYDEDALPYDGMWVDDKIWLPHVLAGKAVYGHFHFTQNGDELLNHDMDIMND